MVFVKSKDATSYYNVSDSTLRKWAREKLIRTETTKGGHWRYWIEDKSQQSNTPQNEQLSNYIIYTRVSSKKQSRNLDKQSIFLKSKFPNYTLITDIGSGINYNRKGFKTILEQLFQGNIKKVVVAHQDRFTRFGFDFFQWMFTQFGSVLETMEESDDKKSNDLTADLMEILTLFTARYYGKRKYNSNTESKNTSESETS